MIHWSKNLFRRIFGQTHFSVHFFGICNKITLYCNINLSTFIFGVNVNTKDITRLMINTAADRGLKEMTDDPKRALRKLVDMGSEFSTGRFQPEIFSVITNILENEDSPYYKLIRDFLFNTDFNCVKTFGINIGYESWTYNARILRQKAEDLKFSIPWVLGFSYDSSAATKNAMTVDRISNVINDSRNLGINTFAIKEESDFSTDTAIYDIFLKNEYSAFFYILKDAQITAHQASLLKKAANVILLINADAPYAKETCDMLYDSGVFYAIYKYYTDADISNLSGPDFYAPLLDFKSSMIFMTSSNSCYKDGGPVIKDFRFHTNVPAIIWDYYYDAMLINEILCDTKCMLHFDKNGNVYCPEKTKFNILNDGNDILHILSETMPKL